MKKIDKAQITRALNKTALRFKKHSPEILVCAGIVGVVASGGLQGYHKSKHNHCRGP